MNRAELVVLLDHVRTADSESFVPSKGMARGPVAPVARRAAASVTGNAIEIVMTRLDVGSEALRAAAALLSEAERQRASRFVFGRDRHRFTVARSRLRELLGVRLDVRPESIELAYGNRGKPALARHFADSDLHFNVSHCGDVAVYAFALGREIGIDVEAVRAIRDADDIAARCFSRHENEAYRALDPSDKPLGHGLYHPLDSFDVSLAPGDPAKILRIEGAPGDHCSWHMEAFSPAPGLVAAVVVESGRGRVGSPVASLRLARPETAS
jgi:4'-phosphopantetheinyl transferase